MSTPDAAAVYQKVGTQKILIGQTPIDFAKTGLPEDSPFIVSFEKQGFDSKEVAVTPTDNALTTIAIQLTPLTPGGEDLALKRTRKVVRQIFTVQEMIVRKKYVDALAALKLLEQEEPMLPEVFVIRGSIQLLLNDQQNARLNWEKALAMDPSLDDVKVRLAKIAGDKK